MPSTILIDLSPVMAASAKSGVLPTSGQLTVTTASSTTMDSLCQYEVELDNLRSNSIHAPPGPRPLRVGARPLTKSQVIAGSICIAHDGYMSEQSQELCSAGVVIYCRTSRQWLKAAAAISSALASNYRGELLGAVMALLIIWAAGIGLTEISPVLHCDNRGVVTHGNKSRSALPQKQEQADLIRLIKYLVVTNPGSARWEWVEGHAIKKKGWAQSTLPEQLNDQADKLAKGVLEAAIAGGAITEGDLPLEILRLSVAGVRVTGSPRIALKTAWGYRAAKALFDARDLVREENFHLVWWAGMGAAMAQYPKMYRVWITKHISDFCGNNVQLYYRSNGNSSPKCKSCGVEDEYNTHICRCRDAGRVLMFQTSVEELCEWMSSTLGKHTIALTVEAYLSKRGHDTMVSCLHGDCNE